MIDQPPTTPSFAPEIAPVELSHPDADSVSHSLAVLATVYHYNHWIFTQIRDDLGQSVAEIGSGIGNITQFLLNLDRVACIEPFEPYEQFLRERFEPHRNVEIHRLAIEDVPHPDIPAGQFDSVICLNVLEHIADDVAALRTMRRLLKPRGRVVILVPALPILFGKLDEAMGHCKRYTLGMLRRALREAGLKPIRGRYMNAVGVPAWFWTGRVLKRSHIAERAARTFDRMVPFLSAMERIIPPPIGQSAILVGTRETLGADDEDSR